MKAHIAKKLKSHSIHLLFYKKQKYVLLALSFNCFCFTYNKNPLWDIFTCNYLCKIEPNALQESYISKISSRETDLCFINIKVHCFWLIVHVLFRRWCVSENVFLSYSFQETDLYFPLHNLFCVVASWQTSASC